LWKQKHNFHRLQERRYYRKKTRTNLIKSIFSKIIPRKREKNEKCKYNKYKYLNVKRFRFWFVKKNKWRFVTKKNKIRKILEKKIKYDKKKDIFEIISEPTLPQEISYLNLD